MSEIKVETFLSPYIRFVNACPKMEGADFYIGNTLLQPNLGFGCFSRYYKVPKGVGEFIVTEAGNKDKVIARTKLPFAQGEVYALALVHSDGAPMAYGIVEPTERKNTEFGHVRICHLCPNLASLDISVNNCDILNSIDYLEVSKYICIKPDKYEFRVKRSDNDALKLIMPNQNVVAGKYNTIYIVGLADETPQLMGIFTVDAASYTGYTL